MGRLGYCSKRRSLEVAPSSIRTSPKSQMVVRRTRQPSPEPSVHRWLTQLRPAAKQCRQPSLDVDQEVGRETSRQVPASGGKSSDCYGFQGRRGAAGIFVRLRRRLPGHNPKSTNSRCVSTSSHVTVGIWKRAHSLRRNVIDIPRHRLVQASKWGHLSDAGAIH